MQALSIQQINKINRQKIGEMFTTTRDLYEKVTAQRDQLLKFLQEEHHRNME
jgi:hypothetical protein